MSIAKNQRVYVSEEKYPYSGYHGCESHCKLEITGTYNLALVTMTETKDNQGTSVTNRSEAIASKVCSENTYDLHPGRCIFVEHYNSGSYNGGAIKPTFSLVTYDWNGRKASTPEWTYISQEQYMALRDLVEMPRSS